MKRKTRNDPSPKEARERAQEVRKAVSKSILAKMQEIEGKKSK
jgi:hypothetical protein